MENPHNVIENLFRIINSLKKTANGYKEINEKNNIIINDYKQNIHKLFEIINDKNNIIKSLCENSDSQFETTKILIHRNKKLNEQIENIKKINLN